jgi:hypothetical protein
MTHQRNSTHKRIIGRVMIILAGQPGTPDTA